MINKEVLKAEFKRKIAEKYGRDLENSHVTERYLVLSEIIAKYASVNWKATKDLIAEREEKQLYYFSMEFLTGRLLSSNLHNMGVYDLVKETLSEVQVNLDDLIEVESDPGLGNGGLGRLAACFMDSIASLNYAGHGNSIRYEYGLFRQEIVDGYQVEQPDLWLQLGNVWEVRKPKYAVSVPFWGEIEITSDSDGNIRYEHLGAEEIKAVPCDIPIIGVEGTATNSLRLWTAEAMPTIPKGKDLRTYLSEIREITQNVYPDDSTESGKYLRIKQEYFFVSAGLQAILASHLQRYGSLDNLPDKCVIQLNDTHPALAIPELMRLLMDYYGYAWADAWTIVQNTFAYTNHTILQEALEKWPVEYIQKLLPRIFMIIEEIDRRHKLDCYQLSPISRLASNTAIIKDGLVHMANLSIIGSFSVNGVAKLHTDIIKETIFSDFYALYPNKFNNKTNGITHRRWLINTNPELTALLKDLIGDSFMTKPEDLDKLMAFVDDKDVQDRFLQVKTARKQILADFIKRETGIELSTESIFDTHAKRLHAYKRQLMKCLHIIHLIQKIRSDDNFSMKHTSFIFAAKAAPSYALAKQIIKLINSLSELVEKDERLQKFIKVVFIPNYRVSVAELLMNGSDVSEQISTAGKEASGTGNMKFMMNGAITLGTMDGANVEIHALVGSENDIIFGLTVEDIDKLKTTGYNSISLANKNPDLKKVLNALIDGSISKNPDEFKLIYDDLIYKNDEFFVLADFDAYCKAFDEMLDRYSDRSSWAKSCLINIAKSGFFSSDRTIEDYVRDIWHLNKIEG